MGPIVLASIGHLVTSIGIGDTALLLSGMEHLFLMAGIILVNL